MTTHIYGIKNCDTMVKAMKWLEAHDIDFIFHNYKDENIDVEVLKTAIEQCGWDKVINKRSTTWRNLSDEAKKSMNENIAPEIARENPSIVKRPLLIDSEGVITLGFKPDIYARIFKL